MAASKLKHRVLLAAFAASGGAALIYEVVWTRALSLVMGSTSYAVSTMLATFMAGLALGAVGGGRHADRGGNLLWALALCELGIGITGILSVPVIYRLPEAYLILYRALHLHSGLFYAGQALLCALVMLPPTLLMGATFPLVSRALTSNLDEMGRRVASAYTINTLGAMVGSVLAGFALIPAIGLQGTAVAAGAINLLAGVAVLIASGRRPGGGVFLLLLAFSFSALLATTLRRQGATVSFFSAYRYLDGESYATIKRRDAATLHLLYDRDSSEGSVRAFGTPEGGLLLQVGGKIEGTTPADRANTLLLAYLPVAAHRDPRNMLVVGLGAGVTLGAAKDSLADVSLVEINPAVVEAVGWFGPPGLLDGVRLIRGDARNFLLAAREQWDLISSEPSYPTESGTANLFSLEYFRMAGRRLAPGGIYAQWLPYHLMTNADVDMMLRTFTSAFPEVMVWRIPDSLDLILLGSREPFAREEPEIRARVGQLNRGRWPLRYTLSRTPRQVRDFMLTSSAPLNTDDRPRLEFRTAKNLRVGDMALAEGAAKPQATP